ncbi:tRNA-dihydrouridine(47) synthase [NAD(P)(+)]-like protein [Entomophthora muscae]|uniref:tRNA-dihydrouridine(47) synthase [NAD(P)(+)]-like protein n=1 Tax=Entomophthora muscae TaxID=34485 RepID=A0ACC2T8C3_9FUNG|nr:tRNA-dihydrouridine(47) synthase [NAD(P)(+)]-like protein [Entomophthora muscae]
MSSEAPVNVEGATASQIALGAEAQPAVRSNEGAGLGQRGVAPIKKEFIKHRNPLEVGTENIDQDEDGSSRTSCKKETIEPKGDPRDDRDRRSHKNKKEFRGQNKNRKISHSQDSYKLCAQVSSGKECPHGADCKFGHSIEEFLLSKEEDIGDRCVNFELSGKCPFGLRCRYLKAHYKDGQLVTDEEKFQAFKPQTTNMIDMPFLQRLRKRQYDFSKSDAIIASLKSEASEAFTNQLPESLKEDPVEKEEYVEVPLQPRERKLIDFRNKTYLAPLTTVGNLPFRRLCKGFGVDITCGEMAMATSLLLAQKQEWSLVRRHSSETIFGVQITGNKPDTLVRCAQVFAETLHVDFVDINAGCPIDMVFKNGAGSSLMNSTGKLGRIIRGMNEVLHCPLTIKFRTGVFSHKPTAHMLIPQLSSWGCAAGILHGRSREQRYTKLADWDYIRRCGADRPMQLFGNGDIMSHTEYYAQLETGQVDGVMIGRGALIKPWIFEEIRRRDYWDISSRERLDVVKDFCNHGLEHWGSDTLGVNSTRRFLLEWMSFAHRYIPTGLLEVLPQGMNDRPPPFFGRDDMETLMASTNVNDWIKISEMFLGKTPSDFIFIPKHKSNSYDNAQG